LKHYVMHDAWKGLAIIAVFLLAGFWLTDRLGRAAIRRFSSRWDSANSLTQHPCRSWSFY